MPEINATHAPGRRSWVSSANGHPDFPIQNLPFGVFSPNGGSPRGGIAIGAHIVDLDALHQSGLLLGAAQDSCALCTGGTLNAFLAAGPAARMALRQSVADLLDASSPERPELLAPAAACAMHMPAHVGDYTDFYAGIHHAMNVGRLFRPDSPLMPNYKYMPIAYHGRASSLRVSGDVVRRPEGQRKRPDAEQPSFGPCERLDYELELGIWIGQGNALGQPVPIGQAGQHIAGFCLLNDWSARDLQAWEYQPLGPFLAKSFRTTLSPWIVTPEALAPFRAAQPPRPAGDPAPLPYLADPTDQAGGALDLELEVLIETSAMRQAGAAPHRLSIGNALNLYWTPAQMVAHHASNGCNLSPGDLLGTGTISSPSPDGYGSLLEISRGGRDAVTLDGGQTRIFIEDGDAVILRARARKDGFATIGFGECRGTVVGSTSWVE
jgi:fumarylacetoacetase